MDNQHTGRLIRELRTERGMTQRELAQQLHVTDRAVSKWERGLCAPDLSLLEPLAEALGCSIPELIAGQRMPPDSQAPEPRGQMESVIAYSLRELREKAGYIQKILTVEEERFYATLDQGLDILKRTLS